MDELKEKLKLVECPFNWHLKELRDRKPASFIIDRLSEKEEEVAEPWVHVCITLTIAYLHSENGDLIKSIETLKVCDEILATTTDALIVRYKAAFQTICNASRAVVLTMLSTPTEVKEFADKIVAIGDLDLYNQAAASAIKANVFLEFGVTGSITALQFAKEALQKNSSEADWHFLMGKLLSRIRHFSQDHAISVAEMSHLQKAYNISQTPRAAIFLANACIEQFKYLNSISYKRGGRPDVMTKNKINELTSQAKKLIHFALEKNQNQCIHILIRCAYGLTKLPRFERDVEKAKELLEESLKRSPSNAMANKLAGDLCLQDEKPMYHQALKHFEIAASKNVFSANFAMFEIQIKLSLNPKAEEFYEKMLIQFTEKNYQILTYLHATEYYLFIRRDLLTAVSFFDKVVKLDKDFHGLTDRWVRYDVQKNVNFYELIANEVRHAINTQLYSDLGQLSILNNILSIITELKPDIIKAPVVPNRVQLYLEAYERETSNRRGRGRGRGNNNGRGRGGRGRGRGNGQQREQFHGEAPDNNNLDRINNRGRGGNRFTARNRSSSRNRIGMRGNESGDRVSGNKENTNQPEFDVVQFDRISYAGDKHEEAMQNPYFVKFLELKYKKLTNAGSFDEWLRGYDRKGTSNNLVGHVANKKESIDTNSDNKFQELIAVINQLKEEINEIKLNETKSCCSADRCHSLKSLQYIKSHKIKRPEEYFSDKNESYKRKYMIDSRHKGKDNYRWKSEDRIDKYYKLQSLREREKYRHGRSPDREMRGRRGSRHYDSYSSSDTRSESSGRYETERRSRRNSFPDKKVSHKSRYSSSAYRDRRHHSPSPISHRDSRDRRAKHRSKQGHSPSSSGSDSRSRGSLKENMKYYDTDLKDHKHRRHQKYAISETEYSGKKSKQKKALENLRVDKKSYDERSHYVSKPSKKTRDSSSSSSRSSSCHDRDNKKHATQRSAVHNTSGRDEAAKPERKYLEDPNRGRSFCKDYDGSSSSGSKSDRKSVSKKSLDLKQTQMKGASVNDMLEYSYEKNSKKNKTKNHERSPERHGEKYLHHDGRSSSPRSNRRTSHRNSDSKADKRHTDRGEVETKQRSSRKSTSRQGSIERDLYEKFDKDRSSNRPTNSKDETFSNSSKCDKEAYRHNSTSSNSEEERKRTKKFSNYSIDKDSSSGFKKEHSSDMKASDKHIERRRQSLSHDSENTSS